ncbi:hypothetical protein BCR34DRAFT_221019 [Clohesyomyces aquaticus]|uniref:Uncharacterized protein n=1 Tax=Clohesyomyces aquaticus TaxID=1231657 RepID=A0A1Y1Y962_9PLEO|nr:hypothetical protein BCR34DRAFT_221019 [Clohesyomyces aquaticus]
MLGIYILLRSLHKAKIFPKHLEIPASVGVFNAFTTTVCPHIMRAVCKKLESLKLSSQSIAEWASNARYERWGRHEIQTSASIFPALKNLDAEFDTELDRSLHNGVYDEASRPASMTHLTLFGAGTLDYENVFRPYLEVLGQTRTFRELALIDTGVPNYQALVTTLEGLNLDKFILDIDGDLFWCSFPKLPSRQAMMSAARYVELRPREFRESLEEYWEYRIRETGSTKEVE